MENSNFNIEKEWMRDHKVLPRISFEPNQPRILKIVQRKREKFTNSKDELVDGIKYKVLEENEVKTFFTASQGLIGKLANVEDETTVRITQKKIRSAGQIKTGYDVAIVSEEGEKIIEESKDEDDIPVIEDAGEPPEGLFD